NVRLSRSGQFTECDLHHFETDCYRTAIGFLNCHVWHRLEPATEGRNIMWPLSRREFLRAGAGAIALASLPALGGKYARAALPAEIPAAPRPAQDKTVQILNPRDRVPLSFIIDDSTCLVNMGRFCMPQFRTAWPQNPAFRKKWKDWPAEIPDAFVREFGEFCGEQGVRGKYSLIPYPACV